MKAIEEIRKEHGLSQTQFAIAIGSTLRTYQGRLDGTQPKWLLSEVISASEMNNGKVAIPIGDELFEITVKKV